MLPDKLLVAVAVLGLAAPMWAQPDEPGRGVARISLMNGDVSVRRGDSGDYVAAAVNAPLVVQDRVLTGASSRAELQFDWANFLRLSANAEARLAELETNRYLVQLARGTVTWRVLRDRDAYVEISTPSVSVRPVRKGTYRVTVLDDGTSEITVRSGEAEIFTPRGSERLRSGRTMVARGTASDPEFRVGSEIPEDEWDRFNISRDRDLERSKSYQYVSRDIYGAEDLDRHGRWVYAPSYGWVWSPSVAVGWAPYRYGRWSWMDWYGWTWVSYDPWGWAPYHYGRWFWHAPVGWCWWPGSIGVRHWWSPGVVAFIGFGNVGVGVGWGRVGWVPLGPHEPFYPWWGSRWYGGYRNRTYVDNRVTVVNNVNVTNIYRNSRIDNAVTVVNQDGFRRGRFDNERVSAAEIRTASVARGPVPVAPGRESLRLADKESPVRGVEPTREERFFSRARPAQVDRVPFEQQQRGVEQIARRSFAESPSAGDGATRTASDAGARGVVTGGEARTAEQRGWRRLNEAPRGSPAERADQPADAVRGVSAGRRFGDAANASGGNSSDRGISPESAPGAPAADRAAQPSETRGVSAGRGVSEAANPRGQDASDRGVSSESARGATERSVQPSDAGRGSGSGRGVDTDWRRFGSPRVAEGPDSPRSTPPGRGFGEPSSPRSLDSSERGVSSDGWRRFGSSRVEGTDGSRGGGTGRVESAPGGREATPRTDGWRNFDSPGARSERGIGDWRRDTSPAPASGVDPPRTIERRNWSGDSSRGGESIRISPPIVRERGDFGGMRSAPGGDFGSRSGTRSFDGPRSAPSGGGVRSAPSAPSSAPSGGGGRTSGGGASRGGGGSRGR